MSTSYDAVVIGSGPNGLTAANLLAGRGWSVLVCEAQETTGGAVRSAEVTAPGFVSDLYSAFYPLGRASPVLRGLGLERHGLEWSHAPYALAHPTTDGRAAVVSRDLDVTAASLDAYAAGDGDAWRAMVAQWQQVREPLLQALMTPFPPVRAGLGIARGLGVGEVARFARFGLLPVRRMADEHFRGEGAALILAGNALHTDVGPEATGGGIAGWLLAMLAQDVGFPVPRGGAGRLSDALVARLRAEGGAVRTGARVAQVLVRDGRAAGVRLEGGEEIPARAVLADVSAPTLYRRLLAPEHVPARLLADLENFQWDHAVVKVDWALSGPVPWTAPEAAGAGTVHLTPGIDALSRYSSQLARGLVPDRPFLLFGQMTTADATRSPAGTESAWAYTHVPQRVRGDAGSDGLTGRWDARETGLAVARMEAEVERWAPGFRDSILARHVAGPQDLQGSDANLHGGAVGGGTTSLHQMLLFRPTVGLGRPETPLPGLYLASASAHPGGGVHGGPGAMAARAAATQTGALRSWVGAGWRGAARVVRGD